METRSTRQHDDPPNPPRYRWLKRIAGAMLITVIAGLLLHWWWVRAADRRYRAMIDSARAKGEPILPEDFDAAPVADENNKAFFLRQAAKAMKRSTAFVEFE